MMLPAFLKTHKKPRSRESVSLDVPLDVIAAAPAAFDIDEVVEFPLPLAVVRERPAAAAPIAPPVLPRVEVPPPQPPPAGAHRLTVVAAAARGVPVLPMYLGQDDMRALAEKLESLARQAAHWEGMAEARALYIRSAAAARAALPEGSAP